MSTSKNNLELSEHKLSLLRELRRKRGLQTSSPDEVAPRATPGPSELSFAQERLWFLDRLEPGSAAYLMPGAVQLRGPLDVGALERAIDAVVQRHESCRCRIVLHEGTPRQAPIEGYSFRLELVDLSAIAPGERERATRELLGEDARRPFDLERGPMLRVRLLRLGEADHVLSFVMHHIVGDGWSLRLFVGELIAAYEAIAAGRQPDLPTLPVQYGDVAAWQRVRRAQAMADQLAYWERRLDGAPLVLDLPTDRPRPAAHDQRGDRVRFVIPEPTVSRLRALGETTGATPFMITLAAWGALLARYSGQRDVLVGVPIANRPRPEMHQVIGLFANTVVARIEAEPAIPFARLVERVRDDVLAAADHQEVPFERLVEALRPERDLSRAPVIQTEFALQPPPVRPSRLGAAVMTPLELHNGTSKLDVALALTDVGSTYEADLEYATALFTRSTAERMARQYAALLSAAARSPETPVDELPLLGEGEPREFLGQWSEPGMGLPSVHVLARVFLAQTGRTPGAFAAIAEGRRSTFAMIDDAAAAIAQRLAAAGIAGPALAAAGLDAAEPLTALLALFKAAALEPTRPVLLERPAAVAADVEVFPPPESVTLEVAPRVAPRDGLEQIIAGIWQEILRVDVLGVHDDFFALGGHSLAALKVMSRVRAATGAEVPLRALFEARTVAALARSIRAEVVDAPPLTPLPPDAPRPMSFAQERFWLVDQLQPGSIQNNMVGAARLTGPLDRERLAAAVERVVLRHESLRTNFVPAGGLPQVVVHERSAVHPVVVRAERPFGPDAVRDEVAVDARRPFDLTKDPLLRVRLVRFADDDHLLVVTMHHIVSDGWSIAVFVRELASAFQAGGAAAPALPIQYADYAAWQREWIKSARLAGQLEYWRQTLSGAPRLELPRHPEASTGPGDEMLEIAGDVVGRLRAVASAAGATPFMAVLAAIDVLFARLTGQDDVVVGTPIANRTQRETEGVIGCFLNTLVLRTRLDGAPTFRELLDRVKSSCLGAYSNQDVPFERIVEALQPDRSMTRNPFFDVLVNSLPESVPAFRAGAVEVEPLVLDAAASRFPMTLYIEETGSSLRIRCTHLRGWFSGEQVRLLLDQLHAVIVQAASRPDASIRSYSLVTPSTRAVVPDPTLPIDAASAPWVLDELDAWAQRTPEAVAVEDERVVCSYAELASRSSGLARALVASGTSPGDVVAVVGGRSLGLIVAILGVLRAGGAFLTVDPDLPAARRQLMLRAAGVIRTLAVGDVVDTSETRSDRVTLDGKVDLPDDASVALPARRPDDPSDIFFTSGTTGTPKAVLGRSCGLSHFVQWQRGEFEVGPGDRVAQLTALSFDVIKRDIFLPLTSGATLCLPPPDAGPLGGARTLRWLQERAITLVHTVPSTVEAWLAARPPEVTLPALRWSFSAGEPLSDALVGRWRAAFPSSRIAILYGPTETTLAKTYDRVTDPPAPGLQPVGAPLPGVQVLVLSNELAPCGVGEVGELVIRTPYRSLGYLGSGPEQSRFLVNPFRADDASDVLYRTGDLGRLRVDGRLEVVGRVDDELKIRGVRVQPSEVAAHVARHPAVASCAVVGVVDPRGDKQLVAYVVPTAGAAVTVAELRALAAAELPAALVPAAFVTVDRLPLLPNGKLDRASLPPPSWEAVAAEHVEPREGTERLVADVWQEVLRVARVGAHDDFFALGGHSLLAAQVTSRASSLLERDVPLRWMFESPTVAGLAARIDGTPTDDARGERRAPLDTIDRGGPLPLSFGQERLWTLDQLQPGSVAHNITTALRLQGQLHTGALEAALRLVVERHEVLRTTFVTTDGRPTPRIGAEPRIDLRVVDAPGLADEERPAVILERGRLLARRPFDLEAGPLLRALLVRFDEGDHALLLSTHHICFDAWSMAVLVREVGAAYAALREGGEPELTPLAVQYVDYAHWQRTVLEGEELNRQLRYWTEVLTGAPQVLELPTDRPRGPVRRGRGARHRFELGEAVVEGLRELSRAQGATLFMTLLAAWSLVLARYARQAEVIVGTPVANRSRPELEPLIGYFANTLAVRVAVGDGTTGRQLVDRLRETLLGAYAHQDLPFERLLQNLRIERDLGHTPLFQVMFALHNAPPPELEMPGLVLRPVALESESAKVDLELHVVEDGPSLRGVLEYDTDLFDRSTIERLTRSFREIVVNLVARPDEDVLRLPMVPADDLALVVDRWNATDVALNPIETIDGVIEAQVRRTPDAIAITHGELQLTYDELDRRANRLAWALVELGVGPDVLVGICMARSTDLLVAVLAIMKAGGAYVPFDPSYPSERLAFMLSDTTPRVMLIDRAVTLPIDLGDGVALVDVVDVVGDERRPDAALPKRHLPQSLAYVLYTSGSTGRPKGVAATHRNIVHNLDAMQLELRLDPRDVVFSVTTLAFDPAGLELYLPLFIGASIRMSPSELSLDGAGLVALVHTSQATVLQATPSGWQIALDAGTFEPRALKALCGGEHMQGPLRERLLSECSALWNVYGPTETTMWATTERTSLDQPINVGRPIANMQVYLLDGNMRPQPIGVLGEIHVAGVGVARGYFRRPSLTADVFLPNPFGEPGSRIYRSGDLGRHLVDGRVVCVGRADNQVKIRGHRIELGEIESVLRSHPDVRLVAVVAREDVPGDKRLVAYVCSAVRHISESLRAWAADRLPGYMVPMLVQLDDLPRTPSGKIDRRALPVPGLVGGRRQKTAPRTQVEATLAEIWSAVLRVPDVGVTDNFFELGGDSILSIQIVSRAARAGMRIRLRSIFEHPTIAELATTVEQRAATPAATGPAVTLLTTPRQRASLEDGARSVMLELFEPLDANVLRGAVRSVLDHHPAVRARFLRQGADWTQEIVAGGADVPFEVVDGSGWKAEVTPGEIEQRAAAARSALDPARGALVRVVLFDLGPHVPQQLLIVVHAVAADAASWTILLEDLVTAYEQLLRGAPVELPPTGASPEDVARRLGGAGPDQGPPPTALPTDRGGRGGRREAVRRRVPRDTSRAISQELPALLGSSTEEVLLLATARAVGAWAGIDAVAFVADPYDRAEPVADLGRTVGLLGWPARIEVTSLMSDDDVAALERVRAGLAAPWRGEADGALSFSFRGPVPGALPMGLAAEERAWGGPQPRSGPATLAVDAWVDGDEIELRLEYDAAAHSHGAVARLLDEVERSLDRLVTSRGGEVDDLLGQLGSGGDL